MIRCVCIRTSSTRWLWPVQAQRLLPPPIGRHGTSRNANETLKRKETAFRPFPLFRRQQSNFHQPFAFKHLGLARRRNGRPFHPLFHSFHRHSLSLLEKLIIIIFLLRERESPLKRLCAFHAKYLR
jgi:hypothetical protein